MDNEENKQDWLNWLNDQQRKWGWKPADLVRASGLTSGYVSHLFKGDRYPGPKTCEAIARAYHIAPEVVYQAAGLLRSRKRNTDDVVINEINEIYERLNTFNQVETLEYFRMKLRIQEERGGYESPSRDVHPPDDDKKS